MLLFCLSLLLPCPHSSSLLPHRPMETVLRLQGTLPLLLCPWALLTSFSEEKVSHAQLLAEQSSTGGTQ